jgi:hypothetical protein
VPLDKINPQLAALEEQYGQETMEAAREEIMEIVEVRQTFARLKHEVRHIARQILGTPPSPATPPVPNVSKAMPPVPSPSPAIVAEQPEHFTPSPPEDAPSERESSPTEEEQRLAAYEAHTELLYCCDRPKLKWFGEIDDLSVACDSCGYVLFARDELMPDGEPLGIMIDAESRLADP